MAGSELAGPNFVVGTGRVASLPHIGDVKRVADYTRTYFTTEQTLQQASFSSGGGTGTLREPPG